MNPAIKLYRLYSKRAGGFLQGTRLDQTGLRFYWSPNPDKAVSFVGLPDSLCEILQIAVNDIRIILIKPAQLPIDLLI